MAPFQDSSFTPNNKDIAQFYIPYRQEVIQIIFSEIKHLLIVSNINL